jgi:hypothetical protein
MRVMYSSQDVDLAIHFGLLLATAHDQKVHGKFAQKKLIDTRFCDPSLQHLLFNPALTLVNHLDCDPSPCLLACCGPHNSKAPLPQYCSKQGVTQISSECSEQCNVVAFAVLRGKLTVRMDEEGRREFGRGIGAYVSLWAWDEDIFTALFMCFSLVESAIRISGLISARSVMIVERSSPSARRRRGLCHAH